MTTWFTSDLHLGHANIIGFCDRPFDTVEEMDEALIENWNMCVDPHDEVFVLGDFAMGNNKKTIPMAKRLNGCKSLVPGNHDKCFPGTRGRPGTAEKWRPVYEAAGFTVLPTQQIMVLPIGPGYGRSPEVMLCHFPYAWKTDALKAPWGPPIPRQDRWSAYRPDDEGGWLLHGHVHSKKRVLDEFPRMIDVGVDANNYMPISMDEICALMA